MRAPAHLIFSTLLLLPASLVFATEPGAEPALHVHGQEDASKATADELYTSKQRSDLSYQQVMEMLLSGSSLIHEGVLRENPVMLSKGADLIQEHYAPYHRPWVIFAKEDQAAFKQMLLTYNPILHEAAEAVVHAAEAGNWKEAAERAGTLNAACVSCHAVWKHRVIGYPARP